MPKVDLTTNVAYLGPEGSFSHIAAFLHVENLPFEKLGGLLTPVASIREVFEMVESGESQYGIVPYENSLAGNIAETLDEFDRRQVFIVGEVYVPVNHVLMSAAKDTSEIARVYSKYEVFGQCHEYLQAKMPDVELVPVASTAHAARLAKQDEYAAAIGSSLAAKYFRMDILEYDLSGDSDNFTRFLVIAKDAGEKTDGDKTTMRFSVPHEPGSLMQVLRIFCDAEVNLSHIALVPKSLSPTARTFFVDFETDEVGLGRVLTKLVRKSVAFEVLGTYPKAEDLL